jgi:hypothetical protein
LEEALPVLPQQGLKRADVEITLIDRYKDLIEEASKCNIDALRQDKADIPGLVGVYAKRSAMRAQPSKTVVHYAEDVARKIWTPIWSRSRVSSNCAKWPGHRWHDRPLARLLRRVP